MATLNDYFRTEAHDFLTALERSLQRAPAPDAAELHRAVRGLRGTAQMAREQRIFDVVSAFESVTRAIADGALTWSDNVAERARETIADLRVLLDRTEDDEQLDARVSEAAARWRETDPAPAPPAAAPVVAGGTADFREFAAREAAGIADTLDHGIRDLQADPMDREPLTAILRRQRALLGSARLEEIPVLADILRAVEDLTRVIVKLDVGAKKEWLDIYRVARDALQTTIAPLLRDELPEPSHSVSRLRHMREELLERYGRAVEKARPPEDSLAPPTLSHPAAPFLSRAATAPAAPSHDVAAPRPGSHASAPPPFTPGYAHTAPADDVVQSDEDMLELGEESVVSDEADGAGSDTVRDPGGDAVMDLTEASVVQGDAAELDVGDPDDEMLELGDASVVEESADMLELTVEGVVDENVGFLELDDEGVVEENVGFLELDDEGVVEENVGVLELDDEGVVEENVGFLELDDEGVVEENVGLLELDDEGVVEESADVLELGDASVVDEGEGVLEPGVGGAVVGDDPGALRQRALELHDVVARATAHDPQARRALEDLLTIIRTALG